MAYGYIVIRYESIIVVCDLAVLHVKFDALDDFLRLEVYYPESVQSQGNPERVLKNARTEVQALIETESHLKVLLVLIEFAQVVRCVSLFLYISRWKP